MAVDPRDELWEATFETYYDSYYEELEADALIDRWQLVDESTKVVVAVTTSGSAISGWALWNEPHFRVLWVVLAGLAAILSIVHATLNVPGRLKDWGDIKRWFATLRIDLETFRYRMQFDPEFPVDQFTQELVAYRRRFGEGVQRLKNDILLTSHLGDKSQNRLNKRLSHVIESSGGQHDSEENSSDSEEKRWGIQA